MAEKQALPEEPFVFVSQNPTECKHHYQIGQLFCKDCKDVICVKCVSTIHQSHTCCYLKDHVSETNVEAYQFSDESDVTKFPEFQQAISSGYTVVQADTAQSDDLRNDKRKIRIGENVKQNFNIRSANVLSAYQQFREDYIKSRSNANEAKTGQEDSNGSNADNSGSMDNTYDTENGICDLTLQSLPGNSSLKNSNFGQNRNPDKNYQYQSITTSHLENQGQVHMEHPASPHQPSPTHYQFTGSHSPLSKQQPSSGIYQLSCTQHQSAGPHQLSTAQQHSAGPYLPPSPQLSLTKDRTHKLKTTNNFLSQTSVVAEFVTPCCIHGVCPTADGSMYTNWGKKVKLLNRAGEIQRVIQYDIKITDVRVSPITQNIWTCSSQGHIMECTPSRSPVLRFHTDNRTKCLCVTVDNCILIGMSKEIRKYTTDGKILLATKPSQPGQSVVSEPGRITECGVTQNIAVTDYGEKPCVIVMDSNFQELFCYDGDIPKLHEQVCKKSQNPFQPCDVRYDSVGNLVISDYHRGCLHLLSGGGDYLRLIYTDGDTEWLGGGIGIDTLGILWVCIYPKVMLLQYTEQ